MAGSPGGSPACVGTAMWGCLCWSNSLELSWLFCPCRPGVLDGNYAEELLASDAHGRSGFVLDRGGAFDGTTTAQAAFTAQGAVQRSKSNAADS